MATSSWSTRIRGGYEPEPSNRVDDFAILEAELDALKVQIRELKAQEASQTVTDQDDVPASAAVRLQRLHEASRNNSSEKVDKAAASMLRFENEAFPALQAKSGSCREVTSSASNKNRPIPRERVPSYAKVLKEKDAKEAETEHSSPMMQISSSSSMSTTSSEFATDLASPGSLVDHVDIDESDSGTNVSSQHQLSSPLFSDDQAEAAALHYGGDSTKDDEAWARWAVVNSTARTGETRTQASHNASMHETETVTTAQLVTERHKRAKLPAAWTADMHPKDDDSSQQASRHSKTNTVASSGTMNKGSKANRKLLGNESKGTSKGRSGTLKSKAKKDAASDNSSLTRATSHYASPTAASKRRAEAAVVEAETMPSQVGTQRRHGGTTRARKTAAEKLSPPSPKKATIFDIDHPDLNGPAERYATDVVTLTNEQYGRSIRTARPQLSLRIPTSQSGSQPNTIRIPRPSPKETPGSQAPASTIAGACATEKGSGGDKELKSNSVDSSDRKSSSRSALLEPIRRRLSASCEASSAATACPANESMDALQSGQDGNTVSGRKVSSSFKATWKRTWVDTETGVRKVVETSVEDVPSFVQPCTTPKDSPSTSLLKRIKRTAEEHAQKVDSNVSHDEAESERARPETRASSLELGAETTRIRNVSNGHSVASLGRATSGTLQPYNDPAILACGPLHATNGQAPLSSQHRSRTSSLRANAPVFIPRAIITPISVSQTLTTSSACGQEQNVETPVQSRPSQTAVQLAVCTPHNNPLADKSANIPGAYWDELSPDKKEKLLDLRKETAPNDLQAAHWTEDSSDPTQGPMTSISEPLHYPSTADSDTITPINTTSTFSSPPFPASAPSTSTTGSGCWTSPRGWAIDAAIGAGRTYGWRGGDGREIKFYGYGPHAEMNPHARTSFRNQNYDGQADVPSNENTYTPGHMSQGSGSAGSFVTDPFGVSPSPPTAPTAPRKMRQWAEKMGYPMVPCGEFEIVRAVEHLPSRHLQYLDGWCHCCGPDY